MTKRRTIREHIAVLSTENKEQTKKIDKLIVVFEKHDKSSAAYREQQAKNTTCINGIKKESLPPIRKAIYALYGLLGSIIIVVIIYLLNNGVQHGK